MFRVINYYIFLIQNDYCIPMPILIKLSVKLKKFVLRHYSKYFFLYLHFILEFKLDRALAISKYKGLKICNM